MPNVTSRFEQHGFVLSCIDGVTQVPSYHIILSERSAWPNLQDPSAFPIYLSIQNQELSP